jgi:hypothetical protein
MKWSFLLIISLFYYTTHAQEDAGWKLYKPQTDSSSNKKENNSITPYFNSPPGKIEVFKDKRIDALSEYCATPAPGNSTVTMKGYRVQAFFDNDGTLVKQKRAEYIAQYNEHPTYIDYQKPNFRLRIGDFRTKLQAEQCREKIKTLFPDAIIVEDDIELPKL